MDDLHLEVHIPADDTAPIVVEDTLYSLKMLFVSRASVRHIGLEWDKPGVYLLLSPPVQTGNRTYVGKATQLGARIRQHASAGRNDWDAALLVRRTHEAGFGSEEIGWLEGRLYQVLAQEGARMHNIVVPGDRTVTAATAAKLDLMVRPIRGAVRMLGHALSAEVAPANQLSFDAPGHVATSRRGALHDLKPDLSFAQALERYIPTLKAAKTRDRYRRELERLAASVAPKKPSEVTQEDCEHFLKAWADSRPKTLALQVTILAAFFQWLVRDRRIHISPMVHIRRPTLIDGPPERILSDDEVQRLIDACESWAEKIGLTFLAETGSRREVVASIRWRDVDLDRRVLRTTSEGGTTVVHPISPPLETLFRKYHSELDPAPNEWVVPNRRPYTHKNDTRSSRFVYHMVKDVSARIGMEASPDSFRAYFASRYIRDNPGDIRGLQDRMGHSRIEVTARFLQRTGLVLE